MQDRFVRVPILLGTNTDEGASFGTTGTDTEESSKRSVLSRSQATHLLSIYPDTISLGCPYGWGNTTWPQLGLMYKWYASIADDLTMVTPRRMLAQAMSRVGKQVFSCQWDVAALNTNTSSPIGVQHLAEIPFIFANPVQNITALGSDPARLELGQMAARMWVSFVTDLAPNGHGASNFVFLLPRGESYVEPDTYRAAGMDFINRIVR
ncbi:hypothetical protein NUU61_005513 [Penicillium alfredii]|uniref:Carboxylesterase type B domain-containing protein n=1 Tax=Penicillium alfredii TaxID=1506179 RepID=A0A9W9FA12_9EURO|nr:uncharacterized protein NUU61_005513 [Penicillium alfredii]KAJ5096157.1 hypothetical protein NUU61_005513 [Penicillium alfredii]